MNKTTKALAAAAVALALSGGVAAAAVGSMPSQSNDGLTTASDHSGIDVPRTDQSTESGQSSETPDSADVKSSDATDSTDVSPSSSSDHPDNHGKDVSEAAHMSDATGESVSAVARDNSGLNDHANSNATGDHGKP